MTFHDDLTEFAGLPVAGCPEARRLERRGEAVPPGARPPERDGLADPGPVAWRLDQYGDDIPEAPWSTWRASWSSSAPRTRSAPSWSATWWRASERSPPTPSATPWWRSPRACPACAASTGAGVEVDLSEREEPDLDTYDGGPAYYTAVSE
ncbi:hypothetical protein [Nocardiopsis akebiae]|uniref:hypothetical protein n=1 Tax=Nocardiopsis akebiae TaxID=2831968 RepID=UPI002016266D|nr:hypothetical protein [Nocardiopsis akebiae]